jgi:methionine-rich copper-binding protein CopC
VTPPPFHFASRSAQARASSRKAWAGVTLVCALVPVLALLPSAAWAHAFVSRSEPRAGATLGESPAQIRIWFDGPVEPVSIDIRVENADKQRVDRREGRLSPADNTLVEAGLPPLSPGRYRVFWSVVARDGHRREGTFSFLVK